MDTLIDQSYDMSMKEIPAAKFKEQCLALLDRVGPEGLVITKRGKPVARLLPIQGNNASLIGALRDHVRIHGDILSTGAKWNAES
jgi:prevent-host-death family protein